MPRIPNLGYLDWAADRPPIKEGTLQFDLTLDEPLDSSQPNRLQKIEYVSPTDWTIDRSIFILNCFHHIPPPALLETVVWDTLNLAVRADLPWRVLAVVERLSAKFQSPVSLTAPSGQPRITVKLSAERSTKIKKRDTLLATTGKYLNRQLPKLWQSLEGHHHVQTIPSIGQLRWTDRRNGNRYLELLLTSPLVGEAVRPRERFGLDETGKLLTVLPTGERFCEVSSTGMPCLVEMLHFLAAGTYPVECSVLNPTRIHIWCKRYANRLDWEQENIDLVRWSREWRRMLEPEGVIA